MRLSVLLPACFLTVMPHAFAADAIALKNGDIVQGELISENESQIVIEVTNESGTIKHKRTILTSDIKDFQRETPRQKEARHAYEALGKWVLDPNRECAKSDYERGIEVFNKYITTYPESKFVEEARQRMGMWKDDLLHVEQGQVKFDNRWMTPEEKQPLWDEYVKMQAVDPAAAYLQSLREYQSKLEAQRNQTAGEIASIQAAVMNYRNLANQGSIDKNNADLGNASIQLAQKQQQLATLDAKLADTLGRVTQAGSAYRVAYDASRQKLPPIASARVGTPTSTVVSQQREVPTPEFQRRPEWLGLMAIWQGLLIVAALASAIIYSFYRLTR